MPKSLKNIELFTLIAEGNKKAFDRFFDLYYMRLVNFSNLILRDKNSAEDVVSEVLTNLLIEKERVFKMKNFESYLYTAVKNKSLTQLSKSKRELKIDWSIETVNLSTPQLTPLDLLEEQEFAEFIDKMVDNLPKKRKMVFQLIRQDGLTYNQVSEIMDISSRTVEVHLKLAIHHFRREIATFLGRKEKKGKSAKIFF